MEMFPLVDCERTDEDYVSPPFWWDQIYHVSERSAYPDSGSEIRGGRNGWKVRMSGVLIDERSLW